MKQAVSEARSMVKSRLGLIEDQIKRMDENYKKLQEERQQLGDTACCFGAVLARGGRRVACRRDRQLTMYGGVAAVLRCQQRRAVGQLRADIFRILSVWLHVARRRL